jgi:4-amino-4-deoxy-L-arabinose transferase-like glycosyltransferase
MLSIPKRWVSWQAAKNILIGFGIFAMFFLFYLWRLGNIVPGLSPHEVAARTASNSFKDILDNPLNAPHKTMQFVLQILGYHGAFWMRSVSVIFAAVFIASIYLLLRNWFGKFASFAGTILFATTPWVIIIARNASPDVMLLSSAVLLAAYLSLKHAEKYINIYWFIFVVSLAVVIDTPGLIWFLLIAFLFGFKQIPKTILKVEKFMAIAGITILILLIAPLGFAFVQNTNVLKEWVGLPSAIPNVIDIVTSVSNAATSLTYQMYKHVDYSIGKFAVLTIAQVTLGVIGLFALWKKSSKELFLTLTLLVLGILLAGVNDSSRYLAISLPAVAILDAVGLRYLYEKWFRVFPLNPIPRGFAYIFIFVLILGQLAYGVRYALLAWPHSLETRKVYVIK